MYVWSEIHKTGNLALLVYSGNPTEEEVFQAWEDLDASFIKEFGISESRMDYLLKVKGLVDAMCNALISDSAIAKTTVKIKEKEIEDMFRAQQSEEIGRVISQVKKFMGQRVDLKTTTIYEFYNDYNLMVSQYKAGVN